MRGRTASATAVVAVLALLLGAAAPAHAKASKFPTWAEVQKAKGSAAAVRREYRKVSAAIAGLAAAAQTAGQTELVKEAAYTVAAQQLQQASDTEAKLGTEAAAASSAAKAARKRYGAIASQLYLTGGQSITMRLVLAKGGQDALLRGLGMMTQLTSQSDGLRQQALQSQAVAEALHSQAAQAARVRQQDSVQAAGALQAAEAAAQAAQTAETEQQQRSKTLYAQAAALKGTALAVQKKYYQGVAYRKALAQKRAEAAAKAAAQSGGQLVQIANGITPDASAAQSYARSAIGKYGWNSDQYGCLVTLWTLESGWRDNAYNASSGAYGIPQALPGSKMASFGSDWMTDADTQIDWGLAYISSRYGTPCGALSFETSHVPYWY